MSLSLRASFIPYVVVLAWISAATGAHAQSTVVLRSWDPGAGEPFAVDHTVVDLGAGVAYVMTEQRTPARRGAQPRLQIVARRLSGGATRWTTRRAAVPLTVEGGRLVALRALRSPADVVLLDPRNGRPGGVCTGRRFSIGEGLGYSTSLVAARYAGVAYLVLTERHWYAGGAAMPPEIDSNSSTTRYYALSVNGSRCTLTAVADSPVPDPTAASTQLTRTREGAEWVFALTLANQTRIVIWRSPEPFGVEVAADDRYVVLNERRVTTPYSIVMHATFFDARTGVRAFEGDAQGAAFAFTGHLLLAPGPGLAVSDGPTGRLVWSQAGRTPRPPQSPPP